ncbi:MAG: hypothetical protein J5829_05075 [Lachnospiraceae bacterium]|nr:hypothetical protein [Lachnospiraceae bacterium]
MIDVKVLFESRIKDADFVNWATDRERRFRFVVYQGMPAMEEKIDSLDLSVRSRNCLRRAGYDTVNSFVNDFDRREDFLRLRNVGRRSIEEIMMKLFLYTYDNLKPEKRKAYLEKVREMN